MQKSFSLYSKQLLLGQIYDTALTQIDSFFAERSIKYGQPVMRGTKTRVLDASVINQAEQPSVAMTETVLPWVKGEGDYLGIALRSDFAPVGSTLAADDKVDYVTKVEMIPGQYSARAPVRIMSLGRVAIYVDIVKEVSSTAYYDGTSIIAAKDQPEGSIIIGTFLTEPKAGTISVLQVNNLI
ncbi:MAG: structural cement protein Gp24 [Janthinobacterium lividum]